MARNHFHIALPKHSTVAHNLPHPHHSSTHSSTNTISSSPLAKSQSLPTSHDHPDTPHPHPHHTATLPISYLDSHVPPFAKHHHEFQVQHSFRDAKREARHSSTASATQIPEYILEAAEPVEIHQRTAEEIAQDQAEWEAIARAREAARRRVTIDLTSERMNGETKMESVVMIDRVDTAVSEALSGSEGTVSPNRD